MFEQTQQQVRPAIEKMLAEADSAVNGTTESFSYSDVFDTEEE